MYHYNSGPQSELVQNIPMTDWWPYNYIICYQVELTDVHKGDLFVCNGNAEITTEYGPINISVGGYIILAKNKDDVKGQLVAPAYGGNVNQNEHHRPFFHGGTCVVDSDDYKYCNFILYCASTGVRNGDLIKLEQDYGRLYILQYREKY